jgi:hypothetical protein
MGRALRPEVASAPHEASAAARHPDTPRSHLGLLSGTDHTRPTTCTHTHTHTYTRQAKSSPYYMRQEDVLHNDIKTHINTHININNSSNNNHGNSNNNSTPKTQNEYDAMSSDTDGENETGAV